MNKNTFQPASEFVIDDRAALKVVLDPLRNQILEVLIVTPLNVKQMAERLGLVPSKLYYHVKMLEKHGFIIVVETRLIANMVEKYYQASAQTYRVDPSLLSFTSDSGQENVQAILRSVLDTTREDILRSVEARAVALSEGNQGQERTMVLTRHNSRLSEARAAGFRDRLLALLTEFDEADEENGDSPYAFTAAFYPSLYFSEE